LRFWILYFCFICSGCALTESYPPDWPEPIAAQVVHGCPDISGKYRVLGQAASDAAYLENLGDMLVDSRLSDEYVTLTQEDEYLQIITNTMQVSLVRDEDFDCRDGKLWISRNNWAGHDDAQTSAIGREHVEIGFSKAEGNSLLAEAQATVAGIGLFLIIPIPFAGKLTNYVLWQPAVSD